MDALSDMVIESVESHIPESIVEIFSELGNLSGELETIIPNHTTPVSFDAFSVILYRIAQIELRVAHLSEEDRNFLTKGSIDIESLIHQVRVIFNVIRKVRKIHDELEMIHGSYETTKKNLSLHETGLLSVLIWGFIDAGRRLHDEKTSKILAASGVRSKTSWEILEAIA